MKRPGAVVIALALVLCTAFTNDALATQDRPSLPFTGTTFALPDAGTQHLGADVTLTITEPGDSWFFYAHQVGFDHGGGYVGLQTRGPLSDGPTPAIGRVAIFSLFGACDARARTEGCPGLPIEASAGDGGFCRPMTDAEGRAPEGPGQQCFLPFDWQSNRAYRLSIEAVAPGLWRALVSDPWTGNTTVVGTIEVPGDWGALSGYATTWIESYGPMASCEELPRTAARWEEPRIRDGFGVVFGSGANRDGRPPARTADGTTTPTPGVNLCAAATNRLGPDGVVHAVG